jgi:hypothetical protein
MNQYLIKIWNPSGDEDIDDEHYMYEIKAPNLESAKAMAYNEFFEETHGDYKIRILDDVFINA